MPQTFESKFGFMSIFLTIVTLGALAFAYLILTLILIPAFSSSFGQIGSSLALTLIISFLSFIFLRFLVFLLAKEKVILDKDFIQINDGKNSIKANWQEINEINEVYSNKRTFSTKIYRIELDTKFGFFYLPPKIMSNLDSAAKIRKFLITKKELKNKLNLDELGWQIYRIGRYLAFIILGFFGFSISIRFYLGQIVW